MMDAQLMERNLARLLLGEPDNDGPTDPFRKRVFEKKLRRSSVASDTMEGMSYENSNPNCHDFARFESRKEKRHNSSVKYSPSHYEREVEEMFDSAIQSMQAAKKRSLEHVRSLQIQYQSTSMTKSIICERNDYVQHLKQTLNFVRQYLSQGPGLSKNEQRHSNSVYCADTYQCTFKTEDDDYPQSQQFSSNYESVKEASVSKYDKPKVKPTKMSKPSSNSRKQNSQQHPKSVYQSVLEERKWRDRNRRSRMI